MIRFSARGAIFFRYLIREGAYSRQGAYSGQGAYFFFWETNEYSTQNFNIYLKRNNNRTCNSNKRRLFNMREF